MLASRLLFRNANRSSKRGNCAPHYVRFLIFAMEVTRALRAMRGWERRMDTHNEFNAQVRIIRLIAIMISTSFQELEITIFVIRGVGVGVGSRLVGCKL